MQHILEHMRDVNKRSLNLLRKTEVFFLRHLHKKGQLFYRDIVWCQNIKKKCACIHSDNGSRKIPTQKTPSLKNLHPLGKPSPHHPPPPLHKKIDNVYVYIWDLCWVAAEAFLACWPTFQLTRLFFWLRKQIYLVFIQCFEMCDQ